MLNISQSIKPHLQIDLYFSSSFCLTGTLESPIKAIFVVRQISGVNLFALYILAIAFGRVVCSGLSMPSTGAREIKIFFLFSDLKSPV